MKNKNIMKKKPKGNDVSRGYRSEALEENGLMTGKFSFLSVMSK